MIKVFRLMLASLVMVSGLALAQVEVNKADQVALDGIKGIGPATSKRILEERMKGEFKSWSDFESRVKGVGDTKAAVLSAAGLRVNGSPRPAKPEVAQKSAAAKDTKGNGARAQTAKQ